MIPKQVIFNWLSRIRFDLVIFILATSALLFFGARQGTFELLIYKILLFSVAIMLTHFSRQFLFPDAGLWRAISGTDGFENVADIVRAAIVLGTFIFFGMLVSAFMNGV